MELNLKEVLDERVITTALDVKDKEEALRKMSGMLLTNGYIADVDQFMEDIYLREAEGITGIGNGVAIPHGKSKSVTRIGIAIAKLKQAIAWESLDNQNVDLIFLFCVSSDKDFAKNHMRLLSKVAARIADDDLLNQIKDSGQPQEIVSLMCGESA